MKTIFEETAVTTPTEDEDRETQREFIKWCNKTNKSIDINWLDDTDFEVEIFPKSKAEHTRVNKKLDSMGIGYAVFGENGDIVPLSRYKDLHYIK